MSKFIDSLKKKFRKGPVLAGQRVLVVDDDPAQRLMLERILAKQGVDVLLADNGEDGLRKAAEHFPDLILLDERMPVMNGIEMCRKLKASASTKTIPVIFLTSADSPNDVVGHFELGAEIHLSKPINASALIGQIQITLNNQKG